MRRVTRTLGGPQGTRPQGALWLRPEAECPRLVLSAPSCVSMVTGLFADSWCHLQVSPSTLRHRTKVVEGESVLMTPSPLSPSPHAHCPSFCGI